MDFRFFLLKLREFVISNYGVNLIGFKKYDTIYYPSRFFNLIIFIFRLIPFSVLVYLSNMLNIQLIYSQDNTYQLTGLRQNRILPVIFKFEAGNSLDPSRNVPVDLKPIIKYYNNSLPLGFIISNNRLNHYTFVDLEYLYMGIKQTKRVILRNSKSTPLYQLFK